MYQYCEYSNAAARVWFLVNFKNWELESACYEVAHERGLDMNKVKLYFYNLRNN